VLIENWQSRAHYDKYLAWRTETGFLEQVTSLASGDLRFGFYDRTDI
jgi:quinol monooxygenase YgiN